MPSYISLSQHLPMLLTIASILFLIIIFSMNLRTRIVRRGRQENARDLIDKVRSEAIDKSKDLHISGSYSSHQQSGTDLFEFEQTVRQLYQQLDAKNAVLEMLIRQADQRIALINDLLEKLPVASISPAKVQAVTDNNNLKQNNHESYAVTDKVIDDDTLDWQNEAPDEQNNNNHLVTQETATSFEPRIIIKPSINSNNYKAIHDPDEIPMSSFLDPLTANVYELADRGRTNIEIAQYLDEQVGKVELILALRDKSSSANK